MSVSLFRNTTESRKEEERANPKFQANISHILGKIMCLYCLKHLREVFIREKQRSVLKNQMSFCVLLYENRFYAGLFLEQFKALEANAL